MHKEIWVLLEAGETIELIAELDDFTIERLAIRFFEEMEDPDDPDAPKSVEQVKEELRKVIESEDHTGCFSVYELRLQELNALIDNGEVLFEDNEFEVKRGAKVYEAAYRIIMGCDMSYALDPIGYFTKKIELPQDDYAIWTEQSAEWHERILL